ncbi:hypothetical protein ScPMuIL_015683 [Solemya velum]
MDLSSPTLEDLALAGDSVHVPDDVFSVLVKKLFDGINDGNERNISFLSENDRYKNVDKAAVKQAYGGLVTMVTEAAKNDMEIESLSSLLEDCKFSGDRIAALSKAFLQHKPQIQILLNSIGNPPPHIVDIDWRLDYYIKNNHMDKVNEPVYLVSLKTEEAGKPGLQEVQLSCSLEQLQDLVGKLKDATKCLEKDGTVIIYTFQLFNTIFDEYEVPRIAVSLHGQNGAYIDIKTHIFNT